MAKFYAIAAVLWLLLAGAAFTLIVLLFFPGNQLTVMERAVSVAVVLVLAAPLWIQTASLRAYMREMAANLVSVEDSGVRVRLGGDFRHSKGLPDIPEIRLPWSDIETITCERRRFIYPSVVPFSYPLDVYTIVSAAAVISFTVECTVTARRAAREIARRLNRDLTCPRARK